jgi:uncharacterized protein YbjT (DUF2867 family)
MKLAVFGATGTVGSALLAAALDAGHEVRALARTPEKVHRRAPSLVVVHGNAKDAGAVRETLAGCDAALTTLGGFADPDSIRVGTATIMNGMHAAGMRRLVVMQGFHLDFPGDPAGVGRKAVLPLLRLGHRDLVPDSRAMAAAVQASDLDWTVVRAPRVVVGGRTGHYRAGLLRLGPWNSVTNGDVAEHMLRCLEDPASVGTAPMVAAGRRDRAAV